MAQWVSVPRCLSILPILRISKFKSPELMEKSGHGEHLQSSARGKRQLGVGKGTEKGESAPVRHHLRGITCKVRKQHM